MNDTALRWPSPTALLRAAVLVLVAWLLLESVAAFAHDISQADRAAVARIEGPAPGAFLYLGAKHMVTGIDHILFLIGVIFFLYRLRDIFLYVSLFTVGHSLTLLIGALGGVRANPYIIDAIIGLSIVYKAFENLGGFRRVLGFQPNAEAAVLVFGLFHGFGLATKLQDFQLSPNGLVTNIVSFNIGVEIGQVLALSMVLIAFGYWRGTPAFLRHAFLTNAILMTAGFVFMGYQMAGYVIGPP